MGKLLCITAIFDHTAPQQKRTAGSRRLACELEFCQRRLSEPLRPQNKRRRDIGRFLAETVQRMNPPLMERNWRNESASRVLM
jgi:hypothetical protein